MDSKNYGIHLYEMLNKNLLKLFDLSLWSFSRKTWCLCSFLIGILMPEISFRLVTVVCFIIPLLLKFKFWIVDDFPLIWNQCLFCPVALSSFRWKQRKCLCHLSFLSRRQLAIQNTNWKQIWIVWRGGLIVVDGFIRPDFHHCKTDIFIM